MKKALVFTKSIENSHHLSAVLQHLDLRVGVISSQVKKRSTILNAFKNDRLDTLVATDALARGMDIGTIDFVVSYDQPKFIKTYIHRIGRTARAGRQGNAITMVEANYLKSFKSMLKGVGKATDLQQEDVTIAQNDLQGYEKAMEMAKESLNSIDNRIKK